MTALAGVWKRKREQLKNRRMPLFRRLEGSPGDLRLTLEIKVIDDQIAECTEQMERKNAKAGARPESPTTEEKQGPHQASPPASC